MSSKCTTLPSPHIDTTLPSLYSQTPITQHPPLKTLLTSSTASTSGRTSPSLHRCRFCATDEDRSVDVRGFGGRILSAAGRTRRLYARNTPSVAFTISSPRFRLEVQLSLPRYRHATFFSLPPVVGGIHDIHVLHDICTFELYIHV